MPGFTRSRGRSNYRTRGKSRYHQGRGGTNFSRGQGRYHDYGDYQRPAAFGKVQANNANALKQKVMNILRNAFPATLTTPDIAKEIEVKYEKKEVNNILNNLQKLGIVQRSYSNPAKWGLSKQPETDNSLPMNAAQSVAVSVGAGNQYTGASASVTASSNSQVTIFSNFSSTNAALSTTSSPSAESSNANTGESDMDYSDMPPLIDGALTNSPEPKRESYSIGGSRFPSISTMPTLNSSTLTRNSSLFSPIHHPEKREISTPGSSLRIKLLQILSTGPSISIADILGKLKNIHNKKSINHVLYAFQKEGYASRSTADPPIWSLTVQGKNEAPRLLHNSFVDRSEILGKRHESSDYLNQMERVSISKPPGSNNTTYISCDTASEPPAKIRRLTSQSFLKDGQSGKNPISQLMEYVQANSLKIDFDTSMHGPDHKRKFVVVVKISGMSYPPVEGSSKKDAKTRACEEVLGIIQQSHVTSTQSNLPSASESRVSVLPVIAAGVPVLPVIAAGVSVLPVIAAGVSVLASGNSSKNAISLVNEYAQANNLKIEFPCETCGPDHKRSFRTTLRIGGEVFQPISAGSKKESKLKAAETALAILQQSGKIMRSTNMDTCKHQEINTYHDRVASMVNNKFNELLSLLPDTVVGRKILAGFVMSQTTQTESGEETQWTVISIGSGNRCVAGDKLSMKGDTVNDSHAEIISRRGLMRFLYQQIESYQTDIEDEDTILTASNEDPSKLEVKPGIKFHLYISTAPCGDSALFAKSDIDNDVGVKPMSEMKHHHPLFENKKQGILRTKVENGEGCIPIDLDANVPTWDGLLRGERLRTMSCSDKLAKWNYVGLQGALLSRFLQPIYMSSLTLGMLFSHGHLTRAVCCRVEKYVDMLENKDVSSLYSVHHPDVAKVSGDDPSRDTGKVKTREYSLNWCFGDETAEVLDGTRGRCEARFGCVNPVSQVSKSSLYAEFRKISKETYPTYAKAKESAIDYKKACNAMKVAFEKAECGTWMSKPVEVEEF